MNMVLVSVLMQVSEKQELITLYEGDSEVARHKELKTANDGFTDFFNYLNS